ncbi:MAG: pentapeptide repeat-containing protein, partial [Peptostreptococcaceae bacterium]|nr:pentapeptide repeat-containing protein [Peptostreptococcaceae bacterium]
MAYINFKEERYSINKQIENRKKNSSKVVSYILKNKDDLKDYTPCKQYSYKNFNGTRFGKDGLLDEADFRIVESKDIVCSKFIDCNFKNIRYKNCNFIGCIFENCTFNDGGVTFENCIFVKEGTEQLPSLNNKDNLGCYFYNCNMYARFLNCDLSMALFEECNIANTYFEMTYIRKGIIKNSKLDKIVFEDCNLCGFKTLDCYIIDLDFNDKDKTKFDEKTCFGKIEAVEKTKQEYEGIYMTYETIADKFKENNLINNFGEYYYLGKVAERKSVKKIVPKISSYFYWISCGYGQRAIYPVITSLAVIIICTILYL